MGLMAISEYPITQRAIEGLKKPEIHKKNPIRMSRAISNPDLQPWATRNLRANRWTQVLLTLHEMNSNFCRRRWPHVVTLCTTQHVTETGSKCKFCTFFTSLYNIINI